MEILRREFIYVWYYFSVQLEQIFWYWVMGMLIGSAVSVFLKDRIHGIFRSLGNKRLGFFGVIAASILGIASPLCMYGTIPIAASFSKSGMKDDWLAAFMMSSILLNPQLIIKEEVKKMLSNEARSTIIKAHEKGYKSKELADIFEVDVSTINTLIRQYKETGFYELRTHERGRKSSLTEDDKKNIYNLVSQNSDITIDEIIEKLNLKLNLKLKNKAVRRTVRKMGFVYKKKSLHASERERSRCNRTAK